MCLLCIDRAIALQCVQTGQVVAIKKVKIANSQEVWHFMCMSMSSDLKAIRIADVLDLV
jgi:hypothetical protein